MSIIFKIEDRLILEVPTPQTALDIFKGIWTSKLPVSFSQYEAGQIPLFDDPRVSDGEKFLGSFKNKTVLDLGPLEGGMAYNLEKAGAKTIISVEANAILYLKCLIIKEILEMSRTKFLCGDVVEYLKNTTEKFDVCIASGILYHMSNPIELLWLIANKIPKVLIWTHYFDEINPTRNKLNSFRAITNSGFKDFNCTFHRQEYGVGFETNVYCGGTQNYSNWISRESILTALKQFGYTKIDIIYDGDSVNGPYTLLAATKLGE